MVWGVIVTSKKYKLHEWVISFGVTGGCMLFGMSGKINSARAKQEDSIYGIVLLMGYLGADGFTSMSRRAAGGRLRAELRALKDGLLAKCRFRRNWRTSGKPRGSSGEAPTF